MEPENLFLKNTFRFISVLSVLFFSLPANSQVKNTAAGFSYDHTKINQLQIVSYKPSKAKQGKKGKRGKEGKAGPNLKAVISLLPAGDTNILRVIIHPEDHRSDTVYVNPRYGQVKLIADGGDGGNGGQGEYSTGTGGKGGPGGKIEVVFESTASAYANCKCLIFSNEGGAGGWYGDNYSTAGEQGSKGPPMYLADESGKVLAIK